jgi:predicted TIM-barrel fold metal-dependent hydrolase
MALPEEMLALHTALHIQRVVIVTPSIYGTDNAATLYGMQARGADACGVAVIDDQTPESALDAMAQAGVRGIRLNLATSGITDPAIGRQRFQTPLLPIDDGRLLNQLPVWAPEPAIRHKILVDNPARL